LGFFGCCTYSPDGSRRADVDGGSLVVENADTPDAEKIGGALEFWQSAWSPNGELVAFEGDRGTALVVRDVATESDTVLVDVRRPEYLHVIEFSPDGDRIIFQRYDGGDSSSLWTIGVDGSDLRRLVNGIEWADLRPQGGEEEA
jgi:WD40 repeat protein